MATMEKRSTDDIALDLPCGYCRVPAGTRCRTKTGRRATWLHTARSWPIQEAWSSGYCESEDYSQIDLRARRDALREEMLRNGIDESAIQAILGKVMDRRWFG